MLITEQTQVEQVLVAYRAADDDGNYLHTETLVVDGALPEKGTKERDAWDEAVAKAQDAQHAAWKVEMLKPIVPPTKAEYVARLARKQADLTAIERDIVTLTAAVAAASVKGG